MAATPAPVSKSPAPANKVVRPGTLTSPIGPRSKQTKPLPMPTIPGSGQAGGGTWSNPFIPGLPSNPRPLPPRNGGFPGQAQPGGGIPRGPRVPRSSGPIIAPGQLPGRKSPMGSLQEIARRRLQGGV